jgi:hypothetical protein
MSNRSRRSIRNQEDTSCLLPRLLDQTTLERRLSIVKEARRVLNEYAAALDEARACAPTDPNLVSSVQQSIVARAYNAESYVRMAIHVGLDAMNELQDSGILRDILRTNRVRHETPASLSKAVLHGRRQILENMPGLEDSQLTELVNELQKQHFSLALSAKDIVYQDLSHGTRGEFLRIRVTGPADNAGRVSSEKFFDPRFSGLTLPVNLKNLDCHRHFTTTPSVLTQQETISMYDVITQSLSSARDQMYRHVREVEALGLSPLQGGSLAGILAIIGVVLIAIALVAGLTAIGLKVACETGHNKTVCSLVGVFAIIFIAACGGILLAFSGSSIANPNFLTSNSDNSGTLAISGA